MNKKLAAALSAQGLDVTGNKAYGSVRGYEVNAYYDTWSTSFPFTLHFSFYSTDEQKRNIESALRNAAIIRCQTSFTPYGLRLSLADFTIGKLVKRLPDVIALAVNIISDNCALDSEHCPVCGNAFSESRVCQVNGMSVRIDNDCTEKINALIEAENKEFKEAPNNYLLGFCGALLGGLAGAAVAIALYYVGFYASISAVISVMLGTFLYRKFRGKPNKMMIVIVAVTTVVCMALSVFLIYLVASGIAAAEQGLSLPAIEAFKIVMADEEGARLFYTDLGMVLLFSAIGIGCQIAYLVKSIQRQNSIK